MASGDTTMTLQSTTGLPTGTGITLTIDATDPVSGVPTPLLEETVTGVVSGSTVTSLLRGKDGTSAQAHASGANVVMLITANLWNDFQTAYLTSHNQAGGITATSPQVATSILDVNGNTWLGQTATGSAVNYINFTDNSTGNAPIISAKGSDTNISMNLVPKGTGNVQVGGNPVWQYLGYAQITSNATQSSGTPTYVTGLGVSVTIPTGATKVKVTINTFSLSDNTGGDTGVLSIFSGATVGTLTTQIGQANSPVGSGSPATPMALIPAVAGTLAFSVALSSAGGGTATIGAQSTAPAFILVECC